MISDLAEHVPLKGRTVRATKQQAMLTTTADGAISTVWRGACRSARDQRHLRARPGALAIPRRLRRRDSGGGPEPAAPRTGCDFSDDAVAGCDPRRWSPVGGPR